MPNPRGVRRLLFALASGMLLAAVATVAAESRQPSEQDLKQANNPLADFVAFNIQNYWVPELYGLPDERANTLWLRGVVPVNRWLIRGSAPLPTVPGGPASASGLGDINAFAAYLLTPPDQGRQVGVGPLLAAPTATDDALGTGKWQAGAAAVLFDATSAKVQWGGLLTWQASFAGDDDRGDTNVLVAQPFYFFQLGGGTYLRGAPIWVFDLENDTYHLPFGLGIGKVLPVGDTVYNIFIEPQFTFLHYGVGQPALQVFAGVNMQFK